ncbi:hypothetical protein GCM10027053_51870 [Intrasporangium mesophilum]
MEFVNVRTAARVLGVHENTIRNWCDSGVIRGVVHLPGSGFRRIQWAEVERLRRELRANGEDDDD